MIALLAKIRQIWSHCIVYSFFPHTICIKPVSNPWPWSDEQKTQAQFPQVGNDFKGKYCNAFVKIDFLGYCLCDL
jgi:hypothetical protein